MSWTWILKKSLIIGDSISDIAALEVVGRSFAPSNAAASVKEVVHTITAAQAQGVIEALECLYRSQ